MGGFLARRVHLHLQRQHTIQLLLQQMLALMHFQMELDRQAQHQLPSSIGDLQNLLASQHHVLPDTFSPAGIAAHLPPPETVPNQANLTDADASRHTEEIAALARMLGGEPSPCHGHQEREQQLLQQLVQLLTLDPTTASRATEEITMLPRMLLVGGGEPSLHPNQQDLVEQLQQPVQVRPFDPDADY
jgi:uncharacterized protein (DUF2236 family)